MIGENIRENTGQIANSTNEPTKRNHKGVIFGIMWGQGRQIWIFSVVVALASALIALILAGEGWLLIACRLTLLRPIGQIPYGASVYQGTVSTLTYSLGKFGFGYPVTLFDRIHIDSVRRSIYSNHFGRQDNHLLYFLGADGLQAHLLIADNAGHGNGAVANMTEFVEIISADVNHKSLMAIYERVFVIAPPELRS